MKRSTACLVLPVSVLICSAFGTFSSKLDKAFEALEVYDYFKAKSLFYKSLKRDSIPAAYGLSIIYGRDDNPFTDVDSAHKFIQIAERNWPRLEHKKLEKYMEWGVDSLSVFEQARLIDSLAFHRAKLANTIADWDHFIDRFDRQELRILAIEERNQLAFEQAEELGTAEAYAGFLERYPDADQAPQALERYHYLVYLENTEDGLPASFHQFATDFPTHPYAGRALDEVYRLETDGGTLEEYLDFVRKYPDNPNVEQAWRRIYALEVKEVSARGIAEFTLNYPEYPFMNEIRNDFDLAVTRYYPIQSRRKWGFIDESGREVISPEYEWVENFSDGYAAVGFSDGATFINKTGERISEEVFDDVSAFNRGYAVVEKNGFYGVINRLGEWVIEAEYDDLGEYSEGMFYAEKDGKYGYLSASGSMAIPFRFDNATDFHGGVAVVDSASGQGLIDSRGKKLTPFSFDWIEGFEIPNRPARFRRGNGFGLIDSSGRVITDTLYDALGEFYEGHALASMNDEYGFIGLDGDTLIEFRYTFSDRALKESVFENGYARVFQGDKVGIIDTANVKVLPAMFKDVGRYGDKRIRVKKKDLWGYADREVNLVIPYRFDEAGDFRDSVAIVSLQGKFGVIDTSGNFIVQPLYRTLVFADTLLLAADTLFGILSPKGDTLVPFSYSEATVYDNHVIRLRTKSDKTHYFDYRKNRFIRKEENP